MKTILVICLLANLAFGAKNLDHGLVAVSAKPGKVHVSWRLLPAATSFNVYRRVAGSAPVKLNAQPITQTTDFIDESAPAGAEYSIDKEFVAPVPYIKIPFRGKYAAQSVAVADLDGDGKLD
jgi:rhamnogalacturonan endolyase